MLNLLFLLMILLGFVNPSAFDDDLFDFVSDFVDLRFMFVVELFLSDLLG